METYEAKQVNTVISEIVHHWLIWYALTVETMQSNTVKYIQTQHFNFMLQQANFYATTSRDGMVLHGSVHRLRKTYSVACWIVTLFS